MELIQHLQNIAFEQQSLDSSLNILFTITFICLSGATNSLSVSTILVDCNSISWGKRFVWRWCSFRSLTLWWNLLGMWAALSINLSIAWIWGTLREILLLCQPEALEDCRNYTTVFNSTTAKSAHNSVIFLISCSSSLKSQSIRKYFKKINCWTNFLGAVLLLSIAKY